MSDPSTRGLFVGLRCFVRDVADAGVSWLSWSARDEVAMLKQELEMSNQVCDTYRENARVAGEELEKVEMKFEKARSVLKSCITNFGMDVPRRVYLFLDEEVVHTCRALCPYEDKLCHICLRRLG